MPTICVFSNIRKILYTSVNPSFTTYISKWGLRVSKLYRRVFLMGNSHLWSSEQLSSGPFLFFGYSSGCRDSMLWGRIRVVGAQ